MCFSSGVCMNEPIRACAVEAVLGMGREHMNRKDVALICCGALGRLAAFGTAGSSCMSSTCIQGMSVWHLGDAHALIEAQGGASLIKQVHELHDPSRTEFC